MYHYTNLNALMGILGKESIIFRATRYDKMNDPLEYIYAKNSILPHLSNIAINQNLKNDPDFEMSPYVICFSKSNDNLCMWKIYGQDGYGFILEFNENIICETAQAAIEKYQWNDVVQEITYANDSNMCAMIKKAQFIYNQHQISDNTSDLYEICSLIKRDDYYFENEIRYMHPNHTIIEFTADGITYDSEDYRYLKFRERNNAMVPYIEIIFPKEALKGITIGYKHDYANEKKIIELFLKKQGYLNKDLTINKSKFA